MHLQCGSNSGNSFRPDQEDSAVRKESKTFPSHNSRTRQCETPEKVCLFSRCITSRRRSQNRFVLRHYYASSAVYSIHGGGGPVVVVRGPEYAANIEGFDTRSLSRSAFPSAARRRRARMVRGAGLCRWPRATSRAGRTGGGAGVIRRGGAGRPHGPPHRRGRRLRPSRRAEV